MKIKGTVIPYGAPGRTNGGILKINAGAVTVPADIGRVKLLRDHSTQPGWTPVGRAVAMTETEDGLEMEFEIGDTEDGRVAVADIEAGIRDALSVEIIDTEVKGNQLTSGILTAVALVPIPAFEEARISQVTAAQSTDDDERVTIQFAADSPALATAPDTQNDPQPEEDTMEKKTIRKTINEEKDTPVSPNDAENTDSNEDDDEDEEEEDGRTEAAKVTAARAPRGLMVKQSAPLTFSQAVETIQRMRTGQAGAEMTAALADITRSANPTVSAPQWLGQMWDGADYQREIVPTFTQGTLTRMKAVGWRFTKKPEVDDYEGDKKEIPTGTVATEAVEVNAKRLAAGHDIDRAYFDFNESEFLQAFFNARVVDYKLKTDERAAKFAVDSAKTAPEVTTGTEPDLLHAAARARLLIKQRTRVEPTTYLVNPSSMFGLFQITQLDNPAYLDLLGVKPERFLATDLVPEGQVIAYAKQAMTWFELPGSPIRVDAERIDHGGKDSGIFGYYASILNNQNGIVSVKFNEATAGPVASSEG
jgi:hypothetical protein